MAWIELTITMGEVISVSDMRPERFIERALTSAGFELEHEGQGPGRLVAPYKIERHPLDAWITYRQWIGPGSPDRCLTCGDAVQFCRP